MSKIPRKFSQEAPYAELILRPMDTRPIVISTEKPTGAVFISDGTVDDVREAKDWIDQIQQVLLAAITVRRLRAANKDMSSGKSISGDDIPF